MLFGNEKPTVDSIAPRFFVPFAVHVLAAAVFGALLVSPATSAQSRIVLPVEAALETPRVELDLTDARVVVTIDPQHTPRLSARVADPAIDTIVSIEGAHKPGAITQVWRAETGNDAPLIVVELNLTPDQVLVVGGTRLDLEVTLTDPGMEALRAVEPGDWVDRRSHSVPEPGNPTAGEESQSIISVNVTDSDFKARNLHGLSLTATRGSNDLDFINEPLELSLHETEVHASHLHGSTTIRTVASDVTFEDCDGNISVAMEGGLLVANNGSAGVQGEINNGDVELSSMSGTIKLSGSNTALRISEASDGSIELAGSDLQIAMGDVSGPIKANLTGGYIQADSIEDRLNLQLAAGAEADLSSLHGDFAMVMTGGARAAVARVTGHTRIRLDESDLEVSDLRSFELDARGGSIVGTEIRRLFRVETDGSNLDLSLSGSKAKHKINLKGSSTATIQLPTPCRVVVTMPDATSGDQLKVNGCRLDFEGARPRRMPRGMDGRAPSRLDAQLDNHATITVDGRP